MKIIFSKGSTWWSKLICNITDEPVSHVAILDEKRRLVYHSDLLGVRVELYEDYVVRQEKIIIVPITTIDNLEDNYAKYKHSNYDILAMLFIGLSFLLRKYLKIPLPKSNLWNISGLYICTEWVNINMGIEDSMLTPWKLYKRLMHS